MTQNIDRTSPEFLEWVSALHDQMRDNILEHGYTFMGVFAGDDTPSFCYTIGMCINDYPELLLIGNLPPAISESILGSVITEWQRQGKVVLGEIPDAVTFGNGSKWPVRVVEVDFIEGNQWSRQVIPVLNRDRPYRIVQVLWPDVNGVLPDHPDYSTDANMAQPMLTPVQ
jgi:hypothetical protein